MKKRRIEKMEKTLTEKEQLLMQQEAINQRLTEINKAENEENSMKKIANLDGMKQEAINELFAKKLSILGDKILRMEKKVEPKSMLDAVNGEAKRILSEDMDGFFNDMFGNFSEKMDGFSALKECNCDVCDKTGKCEGEKKIRGLKKDLGL